MSAIGRKCSVVNLDPANDRTSYPCAVDVRNLITIEEIMEEDALGPNGAVLYALEELEHNWEWMEGALKGLGGASHTVDESAERRELIGETVDDYILFDCPGQVELFTHHSSLRNIFFRIQKMGYRLVALHLTDSYCLTLPSLYLSTVLLSLRAMLQMDLSHLNVLTKIDKLSSYGPLPMRLGFYTEVQDLEFLMPHLNAESPAINAKFEGLNNAIAELVEDFGLVSFETLAVEDKRSMMTLLQAIDRAGGYAFGGAEGANDTVWQVAMREGFKGMDIGDVQERWIDRKEEFDEKERKEEEARAKGEDAPSLTEDAGDEDDFDEVEEIPRDFDSGVKVVRRS
ncbi:MAG: hypothetical protein MMC23_002139 [Stictis urceolatum]|nr:hypothetical protein [Stictis urceolata]